MSTPGKMRMKAPLISVDDMDKCILRRKIMEFYTVQKEMPTLNKLLKVAREEINFLGSRETLRKIIRDMGFRFRKCRNDRCVLIERNDIVAWRARYLRDISKYRREGRHIVYLDETWIHNHYTVQKCWQSEDITGVTSYNSAGERLIIVHAGSSEGFIEGALLIFKSKCKTGDYHDEMNSANFNKWLHEKLITNLPDNSVVVMDNARYHTIQENKPPCTGSKKAEIQQWLQEKGIAFLQDMTKAELLEIVRRNKPEPDYKADRILREHGHTVLRLPPYHCDLNPIEYVWSVVKKRVASKNIRCTLNEIKALTEEAILSITPDLWRKECDHVQKIESEYTEKDGIIEMEVNKFVINLEEDSSSSESDSSNSQSDSGMSGICPLID